jgi:hypothetical protein
VVAGAVLLVAAPVVAVVAVMVVLAAPAADWPASREQPRRVTAAARARASG